MLNDINIPHPCEQNHNPIVACPASKFFRFMITSQGVKVNLDKIQVIVTIEAPSALHAIHTLNRHLAPMNIFFAYGAKKVLPFFKLRRGVSSVKNSTQSGSSGDNHCQNMPSTQQELFGITSATSKPTTWERPHPLLSSQHISKELDIDKGRSRKLHDNRVHGTETKKQNNKS